MDFVRFREPIHRKPPHRKKTMLIYLGCNIFYTRSPESMMIIPDPTAGINLLLCIVILLLGYLVYRKQEKIGALLISIAFGIFGLSHLNVLLGLTLFPDITFILLRVCGYVLVAAALYLYLSE
jgi:hypothetical protein